MSTQQRAQYMDEVFRPQYHYTAEKNMINDPNGLVYLDGEWHLFHQYNQHEVVHWGHAISRDLVHWEHQEPAIFPDALGQIYSGTAVVDRHNTSGLQGGSVPVIVAFFTYADHHDGTQSQGLAYSNDRARSWTMYDANPVIPNPGQKDFRDPKVFWHHESESWILVVTGGGQLEFYRSADLLTWTEAFSWGSGEGSHDGVWECPDLFELPVEGTSERWWVLSVSVDRGAPAGGSGMQYFIGVFDGYSFSTINPAEEVLWQNWGQDYYAGITWENVPSSDGRRIMISWADNWLYRFDVPTAPFNGQLTVPRELKLVSREGGPRLVAQPVSELKELRREGRTWGPRTVFSATEPLLEVGDAYEALATFDLSSSSADELGIDVRVGEGQVTRIGYDVQRHVLCLDRSASGVIPVSTFTTRHEAPLVPDGPELHLQILVDRSSVEVFADGVQLTDLILSDASSTGFRPYAVAGHAALTSLEIHPLGRTWPDRPRNFTPVTGAWAQTRGDIRGSHEGFALAQLEDGAHADCTVTIQGTRHGNPSRILGEQAAGIALTGDDVGGDGAGTGVAFLAHVPRQELIATDLATGAELGTKPLPFETNTPYRFTVATTGNSVEARVNDGEALRIGGVGLPRVGNGSSSCVALVVDNAEAAFVVGDTEVTP